MHAIRRHADGPPARTILLALGVAGLAAVLSPAAAAGEEPPPSRPRILEERGRPVTLDEIGAGELLRRGPAGLIPLPVMDIEVELTVAGPMVHGSMTQTFLNPAQEVIEAVYVFPLPERAAVNHMEMRIDQRRIVSVARERAEAKKIYVKAKQEGKKAALVEQERPNLFTTSVANIEPGQRVVVHLEYVQEVDYADGEFSLTFPLTFTRRYFPDGASDAHRLSGPERRPRGPHSSAAGDVQHASIGDAGNGSRRDHPHARLQVTIDGGVPLEDVASPSHILAQGWEGNRMRIEPEGEQVCADRDFIVRWRPQRGWEPASAVFVEDREDGRYALAMILPPSADGARAGGQATETLFVIDVSGSMSGTSIIQARKALLAALQRLRPGDSFNLIAFNEGTSLFAPGFLDAREEDLARARKWVHGLEAGGGTEIAPALGLAIRLMDQGRSWVGRRIVLLTDAAVGNEEQVLRALTNRLGDVRLHTLGIGSAPNRYLMREMAAAGRGLCDFIAGEDEAENRIDAFLARLARPVLTDLSLTWEGAVAPEVHPVRLPDLHAGEPLFVSARLPRGADEIRLVVEGVAHGSPLRQELSLGADEGEAAGVAHRWARARVASLMEEARQGLADERIRREVIGVALRFNMVTRYTSLVAVEEIVTTLPSPDGTARTLSVARAAPAGSLLPRGGTAEPLVLRLGLMLLVVGTVVFVLSRRLA